MFILPLLVAACGNDMGYVQVPGCLEESSPVNFDEPTSLGFTPQEASEQMPLSNTVGLQWEDGTMDCLHYSLQLDPTSGRNIDSSPDEVDPDGAVATIFIECNDYVAIDGMLSIGTADGQINEEISITLVYEMDSESGESTSSFQVEVDSLNGSFQPENSDPSSEYQFYGSIVDGQLQGSLTMQTSGSDGNEVWAENSFLAEWGQVDAPQECVESNE